MAALTDFHLQYNLIPFLRNCHDLSLTHKWTLTLTCIHDCTRLLSGALPSSSITSICAVSVCTHIKVSDQCNFFFFSLTHPLPGGQLQNLLQLSSPYPRRLVIATPYPHHRSVLVLHAVLFTTSLTQAPSLLLELLQLMFLGSSSIAIFQFPLFLSLFHLHFCSFISFYSIPFFPLFPVSWVSRTVWFQMTKKKVTFSTPYQRHY